MVSKSVRLPIVLAAAGLGVLVLVVALAWPRPPQPDVRVASASNFLETLESLADDFAARTGYTVDIVGGGTGQIYAQIVQGAPYDVFLSADAARPARLEAEGYAVEGSRRDYAYGRLALWSREADSIGPETLTAQASARIAIADPALAPYGEASIAALAALGLLDAVSARLVYAVNINQAYAMVASGAAGSGFVALPAILGSRHGGQGQYWTVPETLHAPIRQEAVLLARAVDNAAARAFLDYLGSVPARQIVAAHGYGVPA